MQDRLPLTSHTSQGRARVITGTTNDAVALLHSGALNLPELRAKYVNASMADGKGGATAVGVRHFLRFCVYGKHVTPIRTTDASSSRAQKLADESLLMDFAIWLVLSKPSGRSISINTAAKYISEVKAWHERKLGYVLGGGIEMKRLKGVLKGMRKSIDQAPKAVRYGVRTQHLAQALRAYHAVPDGAVSLNSHELDSLNWAAALSSAFCGLMRGGEFALQSGEAFSKVNHLTRADVTFHIDGDGRRYVIIMMRPLKNGRCLRGKTVPIVLYQGDYVDAVEALERLFRLDPVPKHLEASTPLFRLRVRGSAQCMRVDDVRKEVQHLMRCLGLEGRHFGAHSLRIGGATAAAAAGVPPAVIRCCGRWNSDIFEIYTRLTKEAAGRMTAVIGSTAFTDVERGGFQTEELELLPHEMEVSAEFEDCELIDVDADGGELEDEM